MSKFRFLVPLILVVFLFSLSCKKKDPPAPTPEPTPTPTPTPGPTLPIPSVLTLSISNVTDSSAVCGGSVTSPGSSAVSAVGVCWDTLPEPTTLRSHTNNGAGTGVYSSNLTNLKSGRKYYVRAYATNFYGTGYGSEITFTMPVVPIWQKLSSASLSNFTVFCMESNGANIFLGTTNGVIASSDTGNTWRNGGLTGIYIERLEMKGNTVFAMGQGPAGVKTYVSTNNAATWDITAPTSSFSDFTSIGVTGDKLFAGTDQGMYFSTDDGGSWNDANDGLPSMVNASIWRITSAGTNVYNAVSGYFGSNQFNTVFKYSDGINSWAQVNLYLTGSEYVNSLETSGNNVFVSYASQAKVSKNGGSSWSNVSADLPSFSALYFTTKGSNVLCSNNRNYFLVSKDAGGNWSKIKTTGLPATTGLNTSTAVITNNYLWFYFDNSLYRYRYQ